ncbi:MAG: hypothetical protein ACRCYP_05295, partial [Alphaproteobacteria bacterium]
MEIQTKKISELTLETDPKVISESLCELERKDGEGKSFRLSDLNLKSARSSHFEVALELKGGVYSEKIFEQKNSLKIISSVSRRVDPNNHIIYDFSFISS